MIDLNVQQIKLTQGKYALVDKEDFQRINQYKWHFVKGTTNSYAETSLSHRGNLKMHRLIMNAKSSQIIDHINGDSLDNRKSNLRFVTKSQNAMNSKLKITNKSGYKGIFWNKLNYSWTAFIQINKKRMHLGSYKNLRGAWLARRLGERLYFGKFRRIEGGCLL